MPDLTVWPTDGADGSVSSEARWRKMARLWVPSGVRGVGDLLPTLVAGPAVQVAAGQCWIDGHLAELAAQQTIAVTANGLAVVRFTPADNHAELLYRDAATLPTQTDPTYEIPIAQLAASVMSDRRARVGSPPIYPNFATLKLNRPTPADGEQAVTIDDGRTYTFRVASVNLGALGVLPANRWETRFSGAVSVTTDSNGIWNAAASTFNLDGFWNGLCSWGWGATSPPRPLIGTVRLNSVTSWSAIAYATSTAMPGPVTVHASAAGTFYCMVDGYKV